MEIAVRRFVLIKGVASCVHWRSTFAWLPGYCCTPSDCLYPSRLLMSHRLSRPFSACLCKMKATNNTSGNGNYQYEQEERAKTFLQPFTSLVPSRGDKWTSWSKLSLQKAPSSPDTSKWASWIGADSQSFSFLTPPFQLDLLLCTLKCSLEKLDKHIRVCSAGCASWNRIIEPSSATVKSNMKIFLDCFRSSWTS